MVVYGYSPQTQRWYRKFYNSAVPPLPNDISYWIVPGLEYEDEY